MASPNLQFMAVTDTFEYWRLLTNNLTSLANKGVYTDGTATSPNANVVIDGTVTSGLYKVRGASPTVELRNAANVLVGSVSFDAAANAVVISTSNTAAQLKVGTTGTLQFGTQNVALYSDVQNTAGNLANTVNTIVNNTIPTAVSNLTTMITQSVPPGVIQAYVGNTAPATWREAAGQAVSRTGNTANLFAVIGTTFGAGDGSTTFNLPDLRGEFIRGWDHGRGVDVGRALGSFQADDLKAHNHTANVSSSGGVTPTATTTLSSDGAHIHTATTTVASNGAHTHTGTTSTDGAHTHAMSVTFYTSGGGQSVSNLKITSTAGQTSAAIVPLSAGDHSHTLALDSGGAHTHAATTNVASGGAHTHTATTTIDAIPAHTHTVTVNSTGGTETRPRNVALMYIIKL